MENFSLDNIYVVGNDLLDAQHRVILSYMAKIHADLSADNKGRELAALLDRLDISCKLHFLDEENLLEEMGYREIDDHKAQHALFVTHLSGFTGRFEELDNGKNIEELLSLKRWFLEHIQVFDKCYAEYL
jgi:hemerythrin